jgi:hypothetical protein
VPEGGPSEGGNPRVLQRGEQDGDINAQQWLRVPSLRDDLATLVAARSASPASVRIACSGTFALTP